MAARAREVLICRDSYDYHGGLGIAKDLLLLRSESAVLQLPPVRLALEDSHGIQDLVAGWKKE